MSMSDDKTVDKQTTGGATRERARTRTGNYRSFPSGSSSALCPSFLDFHFFLLPIIIVYGPRY